MEWRRQLPANRSMPAAPVVGTPAAVIDRQSALQRRLQRRMLAAGVMGIVALLLLAMLAWLDDPATSDDALLEVPQYTAPVAVRKPALKPAAPIDQALPIQTVVAPQASGAALERAGGLAEAPPAGQVGADTPGGEALPVAELPRLAAGHVLQSGALPDRLQADEWQASLAQAGIPATVETRLQVGPFRTVAEAEAARRKLKALGFAAPLTLGKSGRP